MLRTGYLAGFFNKVLLGAQGDIFHT
jgi:hypothetical protein